MTIGFSGINVVYHGMVTRSLSCFCKWIDNALPPCSCCAQAFRAEGAAGTPRKRAILLDRRCGAGSGEAAAEQRCPSAIRGRTIANHDAVGRAVAGALPRDFETCSLSAATCTVHQQVRTAATTPRPWLQAFLLG